MEEREAPGATIVHLFGPPPAVEGAPSEAPRKGFCWPHSPIIDKVSRLVTCKRCKSQLDPVDVLLQVADQHEDYVRMLEQTKTMRADLDQLRAEEKKIKARMKSHSRKDAEAAVAAERQKMVEQFREALSHARDVMRSGKRIQELLTGKRS